VWECKRKGEKNSGKKTVKIKIPRLQRIQLKLHKNKRELDMALDCIKLVIFRTRCRECKESVSLKRKIYDPEHPVIAQ
jgi:hypothetical protein